MFLLLLSGTVQETGETAPVFTGSLRAAHQAVSRSGWGFSLTCRSKIGRVTCSAFADARDIGIIRGPVGLIPVLAPTHMPRWKSTHWPRRAERSTNYCSRGESGKRIPEAIAMAPVPRPVGSVTPMAVPPTTSPMHSVCGEFDPLMGVCDWTWNHYRCLRSA